MKSSSSKRSRLATFVSIFQHLFNFNTRLATVDTIILHYSCLYSMDADTMLCRRLGLLNYIVCDIVFCVRFESSLEICGPPFGPSYTHEQQFAKMCDQLELENINNKILCFFFYFKSISNVVSYKLK